MKRIFNRILLFTFIGVCAMASLTYAQRNSSVTKAITFMLNRVNSYGSNFINVSRAYQFTMTNKRDNPDSHVLTNQRALRSPKLLRSDRGKFIRLFQDRSAKRILNYWSNSKRLLFNLVSAKTYNAVFSRRVKSLIYAHDDITLEKEMKSYKNKKPSERYASDFGFWYRRETEGNRPEVYEILMQIADHYASKKPNNLSEINKDFLIGKRQVLFWDDSGSGANRDLNVFRPTMKKWYGALGQVAQNQSSYRGGRYKQLVKSGSQWVRNPIQYVAIWSDIGSGAKRNVAVWQPVCPRGYAALGMVMTPNYDNPRKPKNQAYRVKCIDMKILRTTKLTKIIWTDRGTGAKNDVSIWSIKGSPYFWATNGYRKPKNTFYRLP